MIRFPNPLCIKKCINPSYLIITLFIVLFSNTSFAQSPSNAILPYINDLIGRPKSVETDAKLKTFEKALKRMHSASNDFPVSVTVKYETFLSLAYISSILIEGPFEKGSYFFPLKISIGDFELKEVYQYDRVISEFQKSNSIYYFHKQATYYVFPEQDYESAYFNTKKTKYALRVQPYYRQFKGKRKKSPYSYIPEKNESVITGFEFYQDLNNAASHANYAKHFTEKAQKRLGLNDREANIYYSYLYNVIVHNHTMSNGFNEDFDKRCDDFILPIIKQVVEKENSTPTKSNKQLGDYPPMSANMGVFKLNNNTFCSGGNCYYRDERVKFKFGEFTGKFLNNKAIEGTFKTIHAETKAEYTLVSRYKNGFMDSVVFKVDAYSYDAGYNYETNKWIARIKIDNKVYTGELLYLSGYIKGSSDDGLVNSTVTMYNFNFGLKSYHKIQSDRGYAYINTSSKFSYYKASFLWKAVDVKINGDKLVFVSIINEPCIHQSAIGTEYRSYDFTKKDSISLDMQPDYKAYLQKLVNDFNSNKKEHTNDPLMDFNTFQFHIRDYGQIVKNIQNYQGSFIRACSETNNKYNRMSGSIDGAIRYAEQTIKALDAFFEIFETLNQNSKNVPYPKFVQDKIKEWEIYKNSVRPHYSRLKEAVKTDTQTLKTKEQRSAYLKKLSARF